MFGFLDQSLDYSRIGNVIYNTSNEKVAILKQSFPDIQKLTGTMIDYFNKYQSMFPELVEIIENEPFKQLSLFN